MTEPAAEVAAVDLGSNSFHMIVAQPEPEGLRLVDRLREPVRLAAGLDRAKNLDAQAVARAVACLERFGQRLRDLPAGSVRAVGTNTLRQLRNARGFLAAAETALGHPIEVISGYEEARLIYLGVAHSLAEADERRLVMDIGGGSTEFIIGEQFRPQAMESLHMGCVSVTQRYFSDGTITAERFQHAELAARQELEPVADRYRRLGWSRAIGASGTIRTIERCLQSQSAVGSGVTRSDLLGLRKTLIRAGHVGRIQLDGVSPDRAEILPGGLAILMGAFDELGLERMEASEGALREGLLFDLLGRIEHNDIRTASVSAMAQRYHADEAQAKRVAASALEMLADVAKSWALRADIHRDLLSWAAHVHEVGLDISHSQYHKHGAYIVQYSDLAGFSRDEQQVLATLVRAHRRKLTRGLFRELPTAWRKPAMRLAIVLRLAVTLHRGRNPEPAPAMRLRARGKIIELTLPTNAFTDRPLLRTALEQQAECLMQAGFKLRYTVSA